MTPEFDRVAFVGSPPPLLLLVGAVNDTVGVFDFDLDDDLDDDEDDDGGLAVDEVELDWSMGVTDGPDLTRVGAIPVDGSGVVIACVMVIAE